LTRRSGGGYKVHWRSVSDPALSFKPGVCMYGRIALTLGSALLVAACHAADPGEEIDLPDIELSTENLDFGDVNWEEPVTRDISLRNTGDSPLGILEIVLTQDGYEQNFSVLYDFAEVLCDDTAAARRAQGARQADAKDVATDTGFYKGDTADTGIDTVTEQVLEAGCQIPIHVTFNPISLGEVKAGLRIVTLDEPTERDVSYYRDPDEEYKIIILEGEAINEKGRIYVDPIRLDFGFVWAGAAEYRYVTIHNVGQGDLNLGTYEFSASCSEQFSVTAGYEAAVGKLLEPGDSTSLEIGYLPLTEQDVTDSPECAMKIYSDDPNVPEAEVELQANQEGMATDTPPVVELIRPAPGYIVNAANLEVELDMWDANQPANSLSCKIRSAKLKKTRIAECVPTDESGHVVVEIPVSELEPGVDTIEIEVTDTFGQLATASTTILYLTDFPPNDADGDGYQDHNYGGDDCNDADDSTYPEAAEIPDGKDNNCETACVPTTCLGVSYDPCVDEGTALSDDDHDCYVEDPDAENGGDCNDNTNYGADSYPDAIEVPDSKDNDCDGIIDEGTSAYDDDGDGFDEFNGDFDDEDPDINPGAVEYCDGIDNDCDNYVDDAGACIPTDSLPIIVGGVRPDRTDIGVGESVNIGVVAFDPDGDYISYTWSEDPALTQLEHVAIDNISGPVVSFKAPPTVTNDQEQYTYELTVQVQDDDGNQDWAFGYITVHADPVELTRTVGATPSSCDSSADKAVLLPVFPLLLAWARRRQRPVAA
jgi:hypothetical protein